MSNYDARNKIDSRIKKGKSGEESTLATAKYNIFLVLLLDKLYCLFATFFVATNGNWRTRKILSSEEVIVICGVGRDICSSVL